MRRSTASLVWRLWHWMVCQGGVLSLACLVSVGGLATAAPLDFPPIQQQEQSEWCWAAAAQNVLAQFGIEQSQSQIVARASGGPIVNKSATPAFVAKLLRSYGLDANDLHMTISQAQLTQVFVGGGKIIADTMPTMSEHAIVIQGIDNDGTIVISDPFSGTSDGITWMDLRLSWRWIDTIVVNDTSPHPGAVPPL